MSTHTATDDTSADITDDAPADTALKARHAAMWAMGDYPRVAAEVIAAAGRTLVEAVGVQPGERVLDVAAGSGNAAVPAARLGADVTASDLTPDLVETGRQEADRLGVRLRWEVADAEALPHDDATYDVVVSCVGVMFAPHHQRTADELVRVLRPGGRLGLLSWTPTGFIGRLFATMKPFAPAPPPGAQPPPLWGDEAHVRDLLGDRVTDVRARTEQLPVDRFADGAAFRDFFKACYGPTIAVYRALAETPERAAELDDALAALGDEALAQAQPPGVMGWEYLLLTARRA